MPALSAPKPSTTRSPERRAHERVGFNCPVRWDAGGVDRVGWARDASERGAGFTTRAISAPQVGQGIRLVFELDSVREWVLDERAIVARCDPGDQGLCQIGVRLTLPEI